MCTADRRRRARTAGFTLVEVLVGLVVTALLSLVIFQLVQGQGRFVATQSAREEVQQNSRGALDLLASELRTIPAGAIDSAGPNWIRFKLPRAWGTLCDTAQAQSGAVRLAFPPDVFPSDLPGTFDSNTSWGIAVRGAADGREYVAGRLTARGTNAGTCVTALGLDTATSGARIREVTHAGLSGVPNAPRADPAFLYQAVRYDVGESTVSGLTGSWIRRRLVGGNPEPLAGPLRVESGQTGSGGLAFTYFCGSQALTATQLVSAANLRTIDRIRIRVAVQARRRTNFRVASSNPAAWEQRTDSLTVHLRNNAGAVACPTI